MLGRIGLYRLDSPLGRGGMGEVFLAWDERLERRVAIKRIRHDDAVLPAHLRDRFRREARMAARLSHPSIVQIHDLVTDGDGDAIVMEYVEGVTLAERLAAGPLETEEALRLARQIAEGLAAAHEAGLIHRDLKAENVVVTRSGQAKILDFGLACPLTRDAEPIITHHGAIVGTCHAMSPEQASGEELDERTDLFSFGVLLYQMLAGRLPFRGKNPLGTLKLVMTEQPTPLSSVRPDLPAGLSSLVEQLLAKNRNHRPQSAFEVVRKLARLEQSLARTGDSVSEMPTHAYPVVPQAQSQRNRAHRWWLAALGGTLLVVVVVVSIRLMFPGMLRFDVGYADYKEFLEIEERLDSGNTSLKEELDKLDGIVQRSPEFLEGQVRAAQVAIKQYEATRNTSYRDRALSYLENAQKLSPADPHTLKAAFDIELARRNDKNAEVILRELMASQPDDPEVLYRRYRLADRRRAWSEAEKHLKTAISLDPPHWQYSYWLADLRAKQSQIGESRKILKELHLLHPGNAWIQEKLAYLELTYGDPKRAEQIFNELAASTPKPLYYNNIGLARSWQHRYREAKEAYGQALDLEPGHVIAMLNIADADWALDDKVIARLGYSSVLQLIEDMKTGSELSPADEMIKAQCLAHLDGRIEEAKESVQRVLRKGVNDPQTYREASLVYSLARDRDEAFAYAKAALEGGLPPRWFEVPAFAPLYGDPEFQKLLNKKHAPSVH